MRACLQRTPHSTCPRRAVTRPPCRGLQHHLGAQGCNHVGAQPDQSGMTNRARPRAAASPAGLQQRGRPVRHLQQLEPVLLGVHAPRHGRPGLHCLHGHQLLHPLQPPGRLRLVPQLDHHGGLHVGHDPEGEGLQGRLPERVHCHWRGARGDSQHFPPALPLVQGPDAGASSPARRPRLPPVPAAAPARPPAACAP